MKNIEQCITKLDKTRWVSLYKVIYFSKKILFKLANISKCEEVKYLKSK